MADLRRAIELSHIRSAGELLYDHLRGSGRLQQLVDDAARATVRSEDAARFFSVVRSAGLLLRDDRLPILIGHLEALAAVR